MNKTSALLMVGALAGSLVSGVALAQPGGPGGEHHSGHLEHLFEELDTNGDGAISADEIEEHRAAAFVDADADGNGLISEEEARAHHEARRAERRAEREVRRAERGDRHGSRHFERADANDDGVLDTDEFGNRISDMILRADLDENGVVTETELELVGSFMREHRGGRHGRHHRGHHGNWDRDDN